VLHLRVIANADRAAAFEQALLRTDGLIGLTSVPMTDRRGNVLEADVRDTSADQLISTIEGLGAGAEDLVLTHLQTVAPLGAARRGVPGEGGFAWVEVLGEARSNARPLARYHVLMAVAGVIAALGVITANSILIVGAMAVSPDLLPLCSLSVGLVARRPRLIRRAAGTLVSGLVLAGLVATALTLALRATGILGSDFVVGHGGLGNLAHTDYSTVLIALAAGVAAMLSFETRASAAVGVAISVTTIPASAYWGVALGAGEAAGAGGALLVLAVNVVLLVVTGTATLLTQRWLAGRDRGDTGGGLDTSPPTAI
jgi:uncharacterized hydrophobic protein (TIGR00271 family)